jgi:hypothetical protein
MRDHAMPMYYPVVTNQITLTPMEPCNANGEESISPIQPTGALDNDGDNMYDANDPDCAAEICDDGIDNDGLQGP